MAPRRAWAVVRNLPTAPEEQGRQKGDEMKKSSSQKLKLDIKFDVETLAMVLEKFTGNSAEYAFGYGPSLQFGPKREGQYVAVWRRNGKFVISNRMVARTSPLRITNADSAIEAARVLLAIGGLPREVFAYICE